MNRKVSVLIGLMVLVIIFLAFHIKPPTILRLPGSEEVNFCGTTYRSERVLVDGVDIIKRIAEIAVEQPQHKICENFALNLLNYQIKERITFKITKDTYDPTVYVIETTGPMFWLDIKNGGLRLFEPIGEAYFLGQLHK